MEGIVLRYPDTTRITTHNELPLVSLSHTPSELSDDLQSNASFDDEAAESNTAPPFLIPSSASRTTAIDFLNFALVDLKRDCLVLSFLPWPERMLANLPAHALAPLPDSRLLDMDEVSRRVSWCQVVVGVCIVGDENEKEAAKSILNQLCVFKTLKIFVVLLMPGCKEPTPEEMDHLMREHDDLINMGVSDVLIQPELSPGSLEDSVRLMCMTHDYNATRLESMLAQQPRRVSPRQIKTLIKEEQLLLWETIPGLLMPEFPLVDQTLRETDTAVGQYVFEGEHPCHFGRVVAATKGEEEVRVAIKIIAKAEVHSAPDMESVFRECQFLKSECDHPNIARCLEVLHAPKNLYMVCEDAGEQSLEAYCADQQHQRLDEENAMDCLTQVAGALTWMHERQFSHREVCLHHVVVKQQDRLHFTLVDFRSAVRAREHVQSNVVCGTLPCIAPEVALGEAYYPRYADCWSLGVVLLEVAGGLNSLVKSAEPFTREHRLVPKMGALTYEQMSDGLQHLNLPERKLQEYWLSLPKAAVPEDSLAVMEAIVTFFEDMPDECHEVALAVIGDVSSPRILFYLQHLLVLTPEERMSMRVLSQSLNEGS
mmetsp:Transcript_10637/g.18363  ORF Transcript_10637/g.18363 Transcript_10637/m.18363 type:complete len:597 (+) Transcript_10637:104-1894(+)